MWNYWKGYQGQIYLFYNGVATRHEMQIFNVVKTYRYAPPAYLLVTSVPDPHGSAFNWSPGSGSAWIRIQLVVWIRIRIPNADPDPEGLKRAKMKGKLQLKDR
jgi:hypothetical protein